MGWYLDEANLAQVSLNLLDYHQTNIHTAFEKCVKDAKVLTLYCTASCCNIGVSFDDTFAFETHYHFCLPDLILALEEDLEDSHLPGQIIIGNSDPCLHYKQTGLMLLSLNWFP